MAVVRQYITYNCANCAVVSQDDFKLGTTYLVADRLAKHLSEMHPARVAVRAGGALVDKAKYTAAIVSNNKTMKPIAIATPICSSLQRILPPIRLNATGP